jgi:hypothetical protein
VLFQIFYSKAFQSIIIIINFSFKDLFTSLNKFNKRKNKLKYKFVAITSIKMFYLIEILLNILFYLLSYYNLNKTTTCRFSKKLIISSNLNLFYVLKGKINLQDLINHQMKINSNPKPHNYQHPEKYHHFNT